MAGDRRAYGFEGTRPDVHETAHVSRESTLVGDVRVGPDASVWPGAVLRGDVGRVTVGEGAHVGDNASVHVSELADRVMVGHGAVVNDATVGEGTLVGFNATVDDATVGRNCVVASSTVVEPGLDIDDEQFVYGVPAETRPLSETSVDTERVFEQYHSGRYADLADRHEDLFD